MDFELYRLNDDQNDDVELSFEYDSNWSSHTDDMTLSTTNSDTVYSVTMERSDVKGYLGDIATTHNCYVITVTCPVGKVTYTSEDGYKQTNGTIKINFDARAFDADVENENEV